MEEPKLFTLSSLFGDIALGVLWKVSLLAECFGELEGIILF
jgi:hypothetical protein